MANIPGIPARSSNGWKRLQKDGTKTQLPLNGEGNGKHDDSGLMKEDIRSLVRGPAQSDRFSIRKAAETCCPCQVTH